jgi:two-component system, OmpR family, sensor histidine kinase ArlS
MTIKSKISFYISIIFTVLFGAVMLFVVYLFSEFRQQEFKERLSEKAQTTIRLLIEVEEIDNHLLKIIDKNTINQLYNEKTLIFDSSYNLIYSSLDDTKIDWDLSDLQSLKKEKSFFKNDGNNEIYGVYFDSKQKDFFALISANDNFGKRKLDFLIDILLLSYFIFVICTWLLTFYIVKKQLIPLNVFYKKIQAINDLGQNNELVVVKKSKNEINLLSKEFKFMMDRISEVYERQREFTSQASHEMRTPIARILIQLENQLPHIQPNSNGVLKNIYNDVTQLNELINSLLILSKIDVFQKTIGEKSRVDEALYNSIEKVNVQFPEIKVNLNLDIQDEQAQHLEVDGNQSLLEIAFSNLIRNAYLYSENGSVDIDISINESEKLSISFVNNGETLSSEEQNHLYQAFMRGQNSKNKNGLGLGLRISYRIFNFFSFKLSYSNSNGLNEFKVSF